MSSRRNIKAKYNTFQTFFLFKWAKHMCHQVNGFLDGDRHLDAIESRFNTDKADFTLINFIALFVLGIRLTVGKVTHIIRTLKALNSFPILHVDQDNLKLPGIIKVRGILVFNGDKKDSCHLPKTYSEAGR